MASPRLEVVIGIVVRAGRLLICRRRTEDVFGGLWEFPGGKRLDGESIQDCLGRELREELAIAVKWTGALSIIEFDYPKLSVRLIPLLCTPVDGSEPLPLASQEIRWVAPLELRQFRFPEANGKLIKEIIEGLGR
jgi:A/G-specific adenine glycosylase